MRHEWALHKRDTNPKKWSKCVKCGMIRVGYFSGGRWHYGYKKGNKYLYAGVLGTETPPCE